MSVLMELSMFPLSGGESKSADVAQIIKLIEKSGFPYKLTAMSTVVETKTMKEALQLLEEAYLQLEENDRIYACAKFDIRASRVDGMHQKIASVQAKVDVPIKS
ncbi:thiamine-binding protein [Sulfurospirillum sp. 1612]|uniref:thiamine-binding protein n=1 Tax=Sulfurospirillum sp. 1612 TaxID=3094835 RepID=UPI002F91F43E